jgi:tetratricopeptide (TPR) repeat protein
MLQSLLGDDAGLEPLTQRLIESTQGNPFFLEESVRTLVETQELVGMQGAYRLAGALPSIHVPMGMYDQVIAAGQRALALATASGEVGLQALANNRLGYAYQIQGDCHRAIDYLGQTVVSLDGAWRYERFGQGFLPAVQSRVTLACCHAELGRFVAGTALGDEGLQIAETMAHPASLMYAYRGIGLLALRQGDLRRALLMLERAVGLCQDMGFPVWFPQTAVTLSAAYTLAGRIANALPWLTQAMEQAIAIGRVDNQALCRLSLGEAQVLADRLEEAHTLAEWVLAHARAYQERGYQAYALRLLGDIAARRKPPQSEQAAEYYRQAFALAEELGMRPLMAHCHLGFGTLYAQSGHRAAARTELAAAVDLYRAMEMTLWLPQAEAALVEVSRSG